MKTDWSQQHPHTWQAGRAAPCCLFKQPLSPTAECRRHFNQWTAQVPGQAVPESGLLWRDFKIKILLTPNLERWCRLVCVHSTLSLRCRDVRGTYAQRRERERDKKKRQKESVFLWVREKQSCRTDWLLGKAFCQMRPFPPPASKPHHPSPQCEGHPDRQPRKAGLQTVTALISSDKSLICLIHPFLLSPLQNVKHTV